VAFALTPLGDSALILRTGDSLGKVLTAARKLEAAQLAGVEEIVPAFASVGIFFASPPPDLDSAGKEILAALRKRARRRGLVARPRLIEIPVCYESVFAPDLDEGQIHVIAATLGRHGMDGVIATNTTISRDAVKGLKHAEEAGGLSGKPVLEASNNVIRQLRAELGPKFPIIGVGGVICFTNVSNRG